MSGRMRRQQLLPGAIDTATAGQRMAREAFGSSDIDDRSTAPFDCLRWRMRARRWCFQSSEKCILMSVAVYVVLMVVVVGVVLLRYGSAFDQTTVELSCVDARDRFEAGEFRLQCASALLSLNECRKRAQQGLRELLKDASAVDLATELNMEPSHASPSTTIALLLADNPNRSQTKTALLLAQRYAERHGLALRYAPVVVTDTLADDAATQTTMVKLQQIVKGRLDALRDYLRIQLEVAGNSANNASDNFILWLSGDTFLLDDNMPPTSLFAGVKPLFQGVVPHAYPLVYARFDPIGTQRLHVGSMIVRVSSVTLELLDALLKHAREYYNGISGTSVDSNAISKIASITTTTLTATERELWWTILRSLRWHDRVVDAPRLHVRGDRWRLGDALVSVSAEDIGGRAVERQRRRRECLRAYSEIRAMLDVVRGEQRYTDK